MARSKGVVSGTVTMDDGSIYVRRSPQGVWMVSFEPDKQQHPNWRGQIVEHTPPTGRQDNLNDVITWARNEWERRKAAR
jgi:hypothetical protein